jgi:hypothetical protein
VKKIISHPLDLIMLLPTDLVNYVLSFIPTFNHRGHKYIVEESDIPFLDFLPLCVTAIQLREIVDIPPHIRALRLCGRSTRRIPLSWHNLVVLCVEIPPLNLTSLVSLEVLICIHFSVIKDLPLSVRVVGLLGGGKISPSISHIHTLILGKNYSYPIIPKSVRDVYCPTTAWIQSTPYRVHRIRNPVDFIAQSFF